MPQINSYVSSIVDFVNGSTPRTIDIYTVPTGYILIIDSFNIAVISSTSTSSSSSGSTGSNDTLTITFGNSTNSTAYEQTHNQDSLIGLQLIPSTQAAPAGTIITATITTNSSAATETGIVSVNGYLVESSGNTANTPNPPASNSFMGYFYTVDSGGNAEANITVSYSLISAPSNNGFIYDGSTQTVTSNSSGLIEIPIVLGATYQFWNAINQSQVITIPTTATSPYAMPNWVQVQLTE